MLFIECCTKALSLLTIYDLQLYFSVAISVCFVTLCQLLIHEYNGYGYSVKIRSRLLGPCAVMRGVTVIGCLHDPTNVQQTSSKCRGLFKIHVLMLDVCWTSAGSLLDRVNTPSVKPVVRTVAVHHSLSAPIEYLFVFFFTRPTNSPLHGHNFSSVCLSVFTRVDMLRVGSSLRIKPMPIVQLRNVILALFLFLFL